jgi:hypothetical protein
MKLSNGLIVVSEPEIAINRTALLFPRIINCELVVSAQARGELRGVSAGRRAPHRK